MGREERVLMQNWMQLLSLLYKKSAAAGAAAVSVQSLLLVGLAEGKVGIRGRGRCGAGVGNPHNQSVRKTNCDRFGH